MAGFVQDPMRMPTLGSNDQLARTTLNHGSVLSGAPNAAQRRPPNPALMKLYPQMMPATAEGAQKKKQISFPGGPGLLKKQSGQGYGPNGVIYKPGEGPVTSKVPISSPIKGSPQLPQPLSPQGNQVPGSTAMRGMAPPMPTSMPMGKVACTPGLWTLCKHSQNPLGKGENIVLTETESTGEALPMQSITFYPLEPSKYASVLRAAASGEVRPKWKPAPDARNSEVSLSDVARTEKVDSILPPAGKSGFLFKNSAELGPLSEQDVPQGNPAMQAPWMNGPASTYWDSQGMPQPQQDYSGADWGAYGQLTPENQARLDDQRLQSQSAAANYENSPMRESYPDWAVPQPAPTPQEALQSQQKYPLGPEHAARQRMRGMDEPNLVDRTVDQAGRLSSGLAGTVGGAAASVGSAVPAGIGWLAQQANRAIGSPAIESMATGAQNFFGNALDTTRSGVSDVANSFRPSQIGGPSQTEQTLEDVRAKALGAVPDPTSATGYTRPSRTPDRFDMIADSTSRLGQWGATNAPMLATPWSVGAGMMAGDSLVGQMGNPRKGMGLPIPSMENTAPGGYAEHGDIRRSAGVSPYPTTALKDIPEYQEYLASKGKSPATQAPTAGPGPEMINDYAMKPAPQSGESMINDYAMKPGPQAPSNPATQAPVMPVSAQMPQAPQQPVGPPEWASRFQTQIERAQRAGNSGEVRRLERMQAQAPQLVGPSRPDYTKWQDPAFVNDGKARQGGGQPVSPSQAPQVPQPQEMFAQSQMPGARKPDPTQNVAGPMSAPMPQMAGTQKPGPSQDVTGAPRMMQQTSGTFSPPGAGQNQRAMPNMNQMAMPRNVQQTRGTFSPPGQAQAKSPTPSGNLRPASIGAPKPPFQMKMSFDKAALSPSGIWSGIKGGLKTFGRGAMQAGKAVPTVLDDAVVKPPMAGAQGAFGAGVGRADDLLAQGANKAMGAAKTVGKGVGPLAGKLVGPAATGAVGLGLINHGVNQYSGMMNEGASKFQGMMDQGMQQAKGMMDQAGTKAQGLLDQAGAQSRELLGGAKDIQGAVTQGIQGAMPNMAGMANSPTLQSLAGLFQGGGFLPLLKSLFSAGKQNLKSDYSSVASKFQQPPSPATTAPTQESNDGRLDALVQSLLRRQEGDSNTNFWQQNNQQPVAGTTLANATG